MVRKQLWLIRKEKQEKSVTSVVSSHTGSFHIQGIGAPRQFAPAHGSVSTNARIGTQVFWCLFPPPACPSLSHTNGLCRSVNRPRESGDRETHTVRGKPTLWGAHHPKMRWLSHDLQTTRAAPANSKRWVCVRWMKETSLTQWAASLALTTWRSLRRSTGDGTPTRVRRETPRPLDHFPTHRLWKPISL